MEIKQFLDKLGLSQYEQQTYLALLQLGRAKSKKISKESKVSYGRIYEILDRLGERGLISSLPTIPRTFEAIDPKISFKLILEKKQEEITELEKDVNTIRIPTSKHFEETGEKTIILHGKQKQLQIISQMNERAKKEIMSIPGVYEPITSVKITGRRALQRGVKIRRLLRKVTPKNRTIIKENIKLGEEVRQKELTGLRLKIIDKKEAILSIVDHKTKDRISIYTTNTDFANSMAIFFESLWEKSKPIKI